MEKNSQSMRGHKKRCRGIVARGFEQGARGSMLWGVGIERID